MSLKLVPTSQFKKDYNRAKKRGLNMNELQVVLDKLCAEEPLEERHHDHALTNNHAGFREVPYTSRLAADIRNRQGQAHTHRIANGYTLRPVR